MLLVLIGLAAGGAFVWLQLRSESPLLDFSLFRIPQFTSAVIVAFVFGFGNFAANYLIPVTVQQVQGFTPFLSGLLLVPAGVLVIAATPIFGRVADIFPAHLMVMLGLCLFALGNYFMSQTDANTTFLSFAWLIIVARCGMALIIPSLNTSALRALTSEQLHRGSGTINFIRQLGGSCGVTALVVFIERRTQFHVEAMAATQTAANTTTLELLVQGERIAGRGGCVRKPARPRRAALPGRDDRGAGERPGFQRRLPDHRARVRAGGDTGVESGQGAPAAREVVREHEDKDWLRALPQSFAI